MNLFRQWGLQKDEAKAFKTQDMVKLSGEALGVVEKVNDAKRLSAWRIGL